MKTRITSIAVALLIATVGSSALANGPRDYYSHGHYRHNHGGHHDSGLLAPLLFLGLAGVAISAAANQPAAPAPVYVQPQVTYVQPAPTYVVPAAAAPVMAPQPANVWYFCRSVGQYYPYTQNCPEGWQQVSPTPR